MVYYERHVNIFGAISREKTIKKWKRSIKINAIEQINPEWKDLYFELLGVSNSPVNDNEATVRMKYVIERAQSIVSKYNKRKKSLVQELIDSRRKSND